MDLLKRHLCGIHVTFPARCVELDKTRYYACTVCEWQGKVDPEIIQHCYLCGAELKRAPQANGRDQGSHYSQQKKRIADAVALLQKEARPDCKPLIFVATSPGFLDRANEPKFISKLVNNLSKGYGMQRYIWVREFTGNGFPHFHFVAMIPFKKRGHHTIWNGKFRERVPFDPVQLSVYWSGLFGQSDKNSIRVGSKPNKRGCKMLYLSNSPRKAWYLAKYIGKALSDDEKRTAGKLRAFSMDEKTSIEVEPQLFTAKQVTRSREVVVMGKKKLETITVELETGEIIFESENGDLISPHGINWRDVGHGCKVGFEREQDKNSQS